MNTNARPDWLEPARLWPMAAAALVFLLVYAVELGDFGLGIDEEIAAIGDDRLGAWLQQGRWGMSLVTWVLPNFEAIPVLSTLLFGAGLLLATWRALEDFGLRGARATTFAIVHVGFPLWLHVAQFSTFAAGFGAGIAAASFGAGLCASRRPRDLLAGVLLLAFAFAVYQTLAVYALVYMALLSAARFLPPGGEANPGARLRLWIRLLAGAVAGVLVYALVQWLSLRLAHAHLAYVGGFLQLEHLRADPGGGFAAAWKFLKRLVNGRHALYLGWGMAVLAMSWIGLLFPSLPEERGAWWRRGFTLVVFALALLAIFAPLLLSYASLPERTQVAWPLLAAWLAARCPFPDRRWPWARALALAYFSIVACSIGATLFHTERIVRDADRAIALQLVPQMRAASLDARRPGQRIPFTISGIHRYALQGQIQGSGMFGVSFYEHDGGSVWRIERYWKILGIDEFEPRLLSDSDAAVAAAAQMPDWPAAGSVRLVDGIVVVRFGPATPGQLAKRPATP